MELDEPLVLFGVLTDIQYADCDSKPAWWNSQLTRYYRTALNQIDKAFAYWRRLGTVAFALQLGDIIDGVNRHVSDPDIALQQVLTRFESYKDIPTFHTVGNHELYNFYRRDLAMYFHEYLDRMSLPKRWFGFPNEPVNDFRKTGNTLPLCSKTAKRSNCERRTLFQTTQAIIKQEPLLYNSDETMMASMKSKLTLRQSASEPQLAAMLHSLKRTCSFTPEMLLSLYVKRKNQEVPHEGSSVSQGIKLGPTRNPSCINFSETEHSRLCPAQDYPETGNPRAILFPKVDFNIGEKSSMNDSTSLYYTFRPAPGVKFISLDCFEVAVIGYDETDSRYIEAAAILFEHHGHQDFEGWDCADFLEGPQKRFQQMNGAVSEQQLTWLSKELEESDHLQEKVIVFGHVCLHPDSAEWDCLLWNYEKVLDIFHAHNCVKIYLCGHRHQNGYALDHRGIHYVVLAGIIETAPEESAFSTIAIYRSRIEIIGHGREASRTLWFEAGENSEYANGALQDEESVQAESLSLAPSVKVLV